MKTTLPLILFCFGFITQIAAAPSSNSLVDWRSDDGIRRLERSKYKVDFFHVANVFETQSNAIVCGPTTSAIILNALRLGKPEIELPENAEGFAKDFKKHLAAGMNPVLKKYSPSNFFTPKTDEVKTAEEVNGKKTKGAADFGIQLRQLDGMLRAHGLKTDLRTVDSTTSLKEIRSLMKKNLKEKENFIIVNYARKALGQEGGGHISPLGAYDESSDSFLIMDVNPNRAPWVWEKADALVKAMNTFDTVENRGFILVSN